MRVSVRFVGGLFGDDRTVTVTDDDVTVRDKGGEEARRPVAGASLDGVHELARRLVTEGAWMSSAAERAVDGGTTTIEISDGDQQRVLVVNAGDDPPEEVWALVDEVEALAKGSR
jgi:hypothetical protein